MGKDETVKVETQKLLLKTFDNQPLDNIRCFFPTVSRLASSLSSVPPASLILPKLTHSHSFTSLSLFLTLTPGILRAIAFLSLQFAASAARA